MSNRSQRSDKVALLEPVEPGQTNAATDQSASDKATAPATTGVQSAVAPSAPSTPAVPAPAADVKSAQSVQGEAQPGSDMSHVRERRPLGARMAGGVISLIRFILKTALPIAILFGAVSVYKYLKVTAPEVKTKPKTERSFAVHVVKAVMGTHSPMLRLYGNTTAGRKVDIRALVAGQILSTGNGLREGGSVKAGDTLLRIDPFDYRQAKIEADAQSVSAQAKLQEQMASLASENSSLRFARQQLKLSKTDLQRAIPLARRGTVSKRTLDDRRNILIGREQSVEKLQISIRVWQARIAQQKATIERMASAVSRAARKLKETKLIAPFDAYVTQVSAQLGRIVSANDKVATLIDRNWIEVRFTLSDRQFGRIMAADKTLQGRKVLVSWQVGNHPLTYPAKIERVGAQIAADSGGIEIYARLEDPLQPVELRPGAFVEIAVPDVKYADVYRLPNTVLYNGSTVYAVVKGRLVARKVTQVGISHSDVLLSGAIKPGDQIINTRLSTPGDGLKVSVQKP